MGDREDLEAAIRAHPAEAAAALEAVQPGTTAPLTVDSLVAAAAILGGAVEQLWVDQLDRLALRDAFVGALRARGVSVADPAGEEPAEPFADHLKADDAARFIPQATAFRCRVLLDDHVVGSGCLVGPSLVLTAWHVVAVQPPALPQAPSPLLRVALADGSVQEVGVPPVYQSLCGDAEYEGRAPRADDEVAGRNDVAVLVMDRPAAAHLGFLRLPARPRDAQSRSTLVLLHFPGGLDRGIGFGRLSKIRNVTARWRHDISTDAGSSGGPCFDRELEFAGLHQGRWAGGGRLVPASRFLADLRPLVEADTRPRWLWSLDGTATGPLVLGRDLFFEAVAEAGDRSRVRGVRVKRRDIAGGTTGLGFSHELLTRLLARRGVGHTLVRISFDELVPDLVEEIRRRVRAAGLPLPEPAGAPGGGSGAASPEAAARDRAALLAAAVDAAAAATGHTVWFFLDNPSVPLPESARLALDGFVAAALVQPHLRLVITGFETVSLPGQEFAAPSAAVGAGAPGLVVEYLGGFTRRDVLDLLARAADDLTGRPAQPAVIEAAADRVLLRLRSFNGVFRDADLEAVTDALRPDLELLARQRGGAR